jgi:hypothetical protein
MLMLMLMLMLMPMPMPLPRPLRDVMFSGCSEAEKGLTYRGHNVGE